MTERSRLGAERAAIDSFFDRELMPLARELKSKGMAMLDVAPAPAAVSYYRNRAADVGALADLDWGGTDSIEDLERQLARMWQAGPSPALVRLAPSIARLAQRLRRAEDQPGQVSEFIYVMY